MAGASLTELGEDRAGEIRTAFSSEVKAQNLLELKVYDLERRVLYATDAEEIGTLENGAALREVIREAEAGIVTKTLVSGARQYELYVPVFDDEGSQQAVFELYEPVDYLNTILINSAVPIISIPGLFLLLLAFALNKLVGNAQTDINFRTAAINELRQRLESFVSENAVDAARGATSGGGIVSRKLTTTLFYSDIRDFTGFAEQNSPEHVVRFLNDLMTLQVVILGRHGGDVDKMIGDAVLARFDGADGAVRAVAAAREIMEEVSRTDLPRGLGIGIFRGEVISGAIGPEDRRDFTVIGDAVNVAARLCSVASEGEIVVAAELADENFRAAEHVSVKGRQEAVAIRRS